MHFSIQKQLHDLMCENSLEMAPVCLLPLTKKGFGKCINAPVSAGVQEEM